MIAVDEADKIADNYWEKNNLSPNLIFKTNSIEAVRSMVANGNGVAILADLVYRPWSLESRKVELLNIIEDVPSIDVGIVCLKNPRNDNNIVDIFRKFMSLSTSIK